ncbi:uncharacterized protein LOC129240541 [Anastrepha obliqua]|uniref:uncharacterized protein LOC129240541 n=1 Tax=Anastrepha obliqua TaxID=95512 RepID=UPI00240A0413|nr:uncharacterized protein LOC129240541 [Anastrepha obliqua]
MPDGLNKIFFLLLITQQSAICNGKKNFAFSVVYMNASSNPDKMSDFKYNYHNENPKAKLFYEFKFKETITHLTVHSKIDMLHADNRKFNLLDVTLDACQFYGLFKSKNRVLQICSRELKRVTNYRDCPILPNKTICIKNYTIDPDSFPSFTPFLETESSLKFSRLF